MDSIVPHPQSSQPLQPPQFPQSTPQPVEEFDDVIASPSVITTAPAPAPYYVEPNTFQESLEEPTDSELVEKDNQNDEDVIQHTPAQMAEPVLDDVIVDIPTESQDKFVQPISNEVAIHESEVESEEVPSEKVSYADSNIQEINISDVVANPYQPRTQFKPEALQELANSIKEHGVIQPLVVTKTPNGFEIVVGERRFRASQLAGLTKVPAIVKNSLHDQTKLEVALIENTQRQDLNAIEEARGYDRMLKEFNLTQDQVAKKVGKSRSAVANTLRLLNLPAEIQRGVIEGKITEGHARAILGLGEIEKMILMYQTIQDQGWNVRQVEAKVREITVKRRIDAATPDPKLMALETELRGKLHTQVKIQRQGRGGKITIDFFSDEDLEEIMNRIAEQKAGNSEDDNYLVV